MRSATAAFKTPFDYAHTRATTHCRTLRGNRFDDETSAAAPAAHTRYLSSPAGATLHGKTHGFVLRLPPQQQPHATFMQPLQCVLKQHVTNLHVSTRMATQDDNNHTAIPMRSATTAFKTPYDYAHTSNHSLQNTEGEPIRRWNERSRTRRTHEVPFIAGRSHFTRKNARFRAPASSRTPAPCNIHAAITMRFAASRGKHESLYAHGIKTWQESRTTLNECIVMWCKVSHRSSWMYRYLMQSFTPPFMNVLLCDVKSHTAFMNVLLCDVKSHTALHECIVMWCKVSRRPAWMYCYSMWCKVSHHPSCM